MPSETSRIKGPRRRNKEPFFSPVGNDRGFLLLFEMSVVRVNGISENALFLSDFFPKVPVFRRNNSRKYTLFCPTFSRNQSVFHTTFSRNGCTYQKSGFQCGIYQPLADINTQGAESTFVDEQSTINVFKILFRESIQPFSGLVRAGSKGALSYSNGTAIVREWYGNGMGMV